MYKISYESLELAFENKKLREVCENKTSADSEFGQEVSNKLRSRLADFRAAASVTDLLAGSPSEMKDARYKVKLANSYIIIFCSNHTSSPLTGKKIDWAKVTRIRILSIELEV